MRLTTDLFAYCHEHVPRWNTISISGYHFREKGCSAVQEVAFTLCSGIAYVTAAVERGSTWTSSPRGWPSSLTATTTSSRRSPSSAPPGACGRRSCASVPARAPKATMLRFHTQTGGVTLTAQQPENNIVRVALQGFAAVCGGTQSLHTNGFDEALALPTEHAAKIALRTQQILANESGAADTVDPFAGSYFVESLTDEIELRANELIEKVDALGGSVNAIEFITGEIDESAWGYQERYRIGQDIVVGVNAFQEEDLEVPICCASIPSQSANSSPGVERLQGRTRPGARGAASGGAARGGARNGQPAAGNPPGAQGQLLDRRGLRGDARRVRAVYSDVLRFSVRWAGAR